MANFSKIFFILLLLITLFFLYSGDLAAKENYMSEYNANYTFLPDGSSQVDYTIKITNLSSQVHVNEFVLSLPTQFAAKNIIARDDAGEIIVDESTNANVQKLAFKFNRPSIGKGSINTLYLKFNQDNIYKAGDGIKEIYLPVIADFLKTAYLVTVSIPVYKREVLSVAKPKPLKVEGNKITWNINEEKAIYAALGTSQWYRYKLSYHLKNKQLIAAGQDIVLPPETLYQRVVLDSIKPKPNKVYTDSDGNLMMRFFLNANETKHITAIGSVEVFVKPQVDYQPYVIENIEKQKKNWLLSQSFLRLKKNTIKKEKLEEPLAIYQYVVDNFKNNLVGTFIGMAREAGIPAREIQGLAFTYDKQRQSLSLISNTLHSWPEFFRDDYKLWIPTDPIWQKTSGLDYFNSFDFNHIAFVIHGKDALHPLPPDLYNLSQIKNIVVEATNYKPKEIKEINIDVDFTAKILPGKKYQAVVTITNTGNIYIKNKKINLASESVLLSSRTIPVTLIAPYETKKYFFEYTPLPSQKVSQVEIKFDGQKRVLSLDLIKSNISVVNLVIAIIISVAILFSIHIFIGLRRHLL